MADLPWSEKYRPICLTDLVNPPDLHRRLQDLSNFKTLPNLLFVGPSGTGKTSTALCLVNDKPDRIWLELNAGSERCVNTIRHRVVDFVGKKTTASKFVILDEVNSMPSASQHVLKGVMDAFLHTKACFILCCNDCDKVLPTIQSRCLIMNFQKVPDELMADRLLHVANLESCKITAAGARAVAESARGDLRTALNALQLVTKTGRVTSTGVSQQIKLSCVKLSERLAVQALRSNHGNVVDCMKQMLLSGIPHGEIIKHTLATLNTMNVPTKQRAALVRRLVDCHERHLQGSDSDVQMLAMAVQLASAT